MTMLAVGVCVIAYLAIGAAYARANAIRYYERTAARWRARYPLVNLNVPGWARQIDAEVRTTMIIALLLWPVRAPHDFAVGTFTRWLTAPITDRRADAKRSRDDADRWRETARTADTDDKRDMAAELARICDQRAAELDL